ncbi:MAG: response regulator transcription factor [Candidatus Binatia bacterium]
MTKTVLIVEDYLPLREVTARLLRCHDYEAIEVSTGEEAISTAAERKPDVILLDIGLPGIDGWETLSRLQAINSTAEIPVIIATAQGISEVDIARGYSLGAADYIIKPYTIEELMAAFEAASWWKDTGRGKGPRDPVPTKRVRRTGAPATDDSASCADG